MRDSVASICGRKGTFKAGETVYPLSMKTFAFLLTVVFLTGFAAEDLMPAPVCLSAEERKLYDLMMQYRDAKGLEPIPLSIRLTVVAQTHARDLAENYSFKAGNKCNPHSWSGKGKWTACCYTSDHKQAECMWNKPREITGYPGNGYEIAYYSTAGATAEEGLRGWKASPAHNPVIVNEGIWSKVNWKAVGVGFFGDYGVVWFGEVEDDPNIPACP